MSDDLSVLSEMPVSNQDGVPCVMHSGSIRDQGDVPRVTYPTLGNISCVPSTIILDFEEGGVPSVLSGGSTISDISIINNEIISTTKDFCDNDSCVMPMKSRYITPDEYDCNSVTYVDDEIISTPKVIPSMDWCENSNITISQPGTIKARIPNSRSLSVNSIH